MILWKCVLQQQFPPLFAFLYFFIWMFVWIVENLEKQRPVQEQREKKTCKEYHISSLVISREHTCETTSEHEENHQTR